MKSRAYSLYWCSTRDHDEDWFVIERTARRAADFFAGYEGYERSKVSARHILALPQLPSEVLEPYHRRTPLGWPTGELLEACGAHFCQRESPRSVTLNGETFVEGMLEAQIERDMERLGTEGFLRAMGDGK